MCLPATAVTLARVESQHAPIGLPVGSTTAMWGLLAAFVAVWFAYGAIADAGKAVQIDLAEAYVWGREFQLGYNQHPPFYAWIAGVWFMAFPRTNWAFVLLAVLNSAIGVAGAWRLTGLFANGWQRQAAMMLLLCTPFYTFKCYLYNANSIFLSLWPWTCYFFVRSIERAAPCMPCCSAQWWDCACYRNTTRSS